jgi:hypothetical protein
MRYLDVGMSLPRPACSLETVTAAAAVLVNGPRQTIRPLCWRNSPPKMIIPERHRDFHLPLLKVVPIGCVRKRLAENFISPIVVLNLTVGSLRSVDGKRSLTITHSPFPHSLNEAIVVCRVDYQIPQPAVTYASWRAQARPIVPSCNVLHHGEAGT